MLDEKTKRFWGERDTIAHLVRVKGCHWKYEISGQDRKMY